MKTFGDKHEVSAYLFYEYEEYRYWDLSATAYTIAQGAEIISAAPMTLLQGTKYENKNAAYLFNGNYTYDGKYMLQAMVRRDGSSRFGSNKRWGTFWSVGGGWNIHKEAFMENVPWINELRARISYGINGNQPVESYDYLTKASITTQYDNQIALMTNYLGNPDLEWEETGNLDVGLDIRLFDRLNITLDGYVKKTKNLLLPAPPFGCERF